MKIVEREFRVNNFDLLRIFAATQVLLQHSLKHLHLEAPFWFHVLEKFAGVPMFFVISGFLISTSYERSHDLKNYFKNRILRIYPALWCCILLTIITFSFFPGVSFFNKATPPWFICQLAGATYTPGFLKHFGIGSYNGSLWTIPVELQFYIMLPLVYFIGKKITSKTKLGNIYFYALFLAFLLIAFVANSRYNPRENLVHDTFGKILGYTFVPNFYLFLAGVILQRLQVYKSVLIHGKGLYWLGFYLLFVYLLPPTVTLDLISRLILGIVTISMAYTAPGLGHKLLRGNDVSYGVYIYHGLLLNILVQMGKVSEYNYLYVVISGTFLMAFLSWKLIERPMIKWKKETIVKVV